MTRMHLTITTALLALSSLASAADAPVTTLRAADAGRHVPVRVGGEIAIQLPAVPGSNYTWRVRSHDGLQPSGPIEIIADPARTVGAPGGPQVAVIHLRAVKPGKASAVVEQSRDGAGEGSNYLRYRFIVR